MTTDQHLTPEQSDTAVGWLDGVTDPDVLEVYRDRLLHAEAWFAFLVVTSMATIACGRTVDPVGHAQWALTWAGEDAPPLPDEEVPCVF